MATTIPCDSESARAAKAYAGTLTFGAVRLKNQNNGNVVVIVEENERSAYVEFDGPDDLYTMFLVSGKISVTEGAASDERLRGFFGVPPSP